MSPLKEKKILLCISGSIAAYKAAFLTRLLIKKGADVKVIMTPSSCTFISPLTLSTLSKHEVHTEVSDGKSWNNHVDLGLWADCIVVAPATATTLAKMSHGIADNMVVATYLSAKCPVFFAPAMDLDMWKHHSTKNNIELLQSMGNILIPVSYGELASGLVGDGRMAEPVDIVRTLSDFFATEQDLSGKKVIITAGPTYEAIDPVRFIGNHSSGKMGIALANECTRRGGEVTLVLGPSNVPVSNSKIDIIRTVSAQEMYEAVNKIYAKCDIAIYAAAVADYTPAEVSDKKIKKSEGGVSVALKRTKDIAGEMGQKKRDDQYAVGFALESNDGMDHAIGKIKKKNFDIIVLNSLKDKGAGFKHDTNKVTIIDKNEIKNEFPLKSKNEVAKDIVNALVQLINVK